MEADTGGQGRSSQPNPPYVMLELPIRLSRMQLQRFADEVNHVRATSS